MTMLDEWAREWGVPNDAVDDLRKRMGYHPANANSTATGSEAAVQNAVRIEASNNDVWVWRNNVGACMDNKGRMIRYGLANDSKQMNADFKSSDLIGARKLLITPSMVGGTIAQFVARECKKPNWKYTGTDRERAQLAFMNFIVSIGGDAAFVTGPGTF